MKRITTIFLIVLFGHLGIIAQTDTTAYGVVKNMPVFYEQLKQQLTFPMAWAIPPSVNLRHGVPWHGKPYWTVCRISPLLPLIMPWK